MMPVTRRTALKTMATLAAGSALPGRAPVVANVEGEASGRVPLVHVTDLYHPPQDPDDHLDLATILALPEYDLRGVVLDVTRKFLVAKPAGWDIARDPGYAPVAQMAHLTGRAIPMAMGPVEPLRHPGDTARDRPRREQGGIELLLGMLANSAEPVTISAVGSSRVLAAAFNREPELMRAKTRRVLLNIGATGGMKREWNVALDPVAYVALWRAGLPIDWFPCATDRTAFDPAAGRGTYWKCKHADLFAEIPEGLCAWIGYAFSGSSRGDLIGALAESGRGAAWENVLAGERNMWATISLVMGAGRVLARADAGWRFVPARMADAAACWPCRLDPIAATVDDDAIVTWTETAHSPCRLFGREPGAGFGAAMTEALNALWRESGRFGSSPDRL